MKVVAITNHHGQSTATNFFEDHNFAGVIRALRHGALLTGAEVHIELGKEGGVQLLVGKHLGRNQFEVLINWVSHAREHK